MNQVVTVRLQPPDPAQLVVWLERFNAAANWLSGVAFQERCWHWLPLQRRAYREVRDRFQLPSAAAVVAIRKVPTRTAPRSVDTTRPDFDGAGRSRCMDIGTSATAR